MTRPADISIFDELRSLQLYLSFEFPDDEIRRSRPVENEPYDMLIDASVDISSQPRGTYMADTTMPLVIQRWCDDYNTALDTAERISRLLLTGKKINLSGSRTAGSPTITGLSSMDGLVVGMGLTGFGVVEGSKIIEINDADITMSIDAESISSGVLSASIYGGKSRIPVWKWVPNLAPDPGIDAPDRYLRVDDLQVRILPADEPTKYVAICEVRLMGWRILWDHTDQLIDAVDIGQKFQ